MAKQKTAEKIKVKPLGDRVILKSVPKEDKKTAGGIIIPESVKDDRSMKSGLVVAVGEGKYENGKLIPLSLSVGDKVLYSWGNDVVIDGSEYTIVRSSEIEAIVK